LPVEALTISQLNTCYGESHVLHDVSMTLGEGRVLALLGRNGAGKTTTMLSVVGYQPVLSGHVTLFGEDITNCAPELISRKGIALVPQGRRIFSSLSVQENLDVAHRRGSKPQFGFDVLFEWFPRLKERRQQRAGTLSGGEQQMLAIARALITDPKVVLFDEPSEGLAPQIVEDVSAILHRLKKAGLSIILVEQNTKLALGVADDVVILNSGHVAATRLAKDLANEPDFLIQHLGVY
jgi:branched-chain amino acid transport system ATP-binding protein